MLDATPKSSTGNAYVTAARSTTLITEFGEDVASWITLDQPTQERNIIRASVLFDCGFDWNGFPKTLTQTMRWPRTGVRNADGIWLDYDTYPLLLERATSEFALALSKRDPTTLPEVVGLGLSSIAVGSVRLSIDAKEVLPIVPPYIVMMLAPLGLPKVGIQQAGFGMVSLRRT